jgi:hypothetical protein
MNRDIWKKSFERHSLTSWVCPQCKIGYLAPISESYVIIETSESKKNHALEDFDPEWIRKKFICMFNCNNIKCNDIVAVCGESTINTEMYMEPGMDAPDFRFHDIFYPKHFDPTPHIIIIPSSCPKTISDLIISSYSLYWSDIAACANRIRLVIESILTHYKIRRFGVNNRSKRYLISLNERIRLFRTKNNSIADSLMAIKWIGNEGSHSIKIIQDDLLDAYELLENSLSELFDNHSKRLERIKNEIIKRKGPRSK